MRDHSGYWMAREAPCPRSALIAPGAPSPGVGVGGSSAGTESGLPGVPSLGRGRVRWRPGASRAPGCSRGTEAEARATRDDEGSVRAAQEDCPLGSGPGLAAPGVREAVRSAKPRPWSAEEGGAGRAAFLTWLYLLPSVPSDSRGPTFQGLQTTPRHPAPDFHLPAQRALFAGLHRYANPGAAKPAAWEAGRGHAGVRRGAARAGASGTA